MSRPPKVRPRNLTFGGFFVWQNTVLNLNLNLFMTTYLVKEV